jgi:ribosomal protein S18 acetylase RimI-like enzyme
MAVSGIDLSVRTFSSQTEQDFLSVTNAYLKGWPYTRPIDTPLIAHWKTLPYFQPENIWVAYRSATPRAVLHGEFRIPERPFIHLLAMPSGAAEEAAWLLGQFEERARASGAKRLIGPHWNSTVFYGGYVLGLEPYHPHWAADGTEAYVRAGFRITLAGVVLIRELNDGVPLEECPAGYQIVDVDRPPEFDARAFGLHALCDGQKAAHCYARFYPHLMSPRGGPVGQIGNVTTDAAHRGKGLARIMTLMCLHRLREWGAADVLIATGLENFPALRAYERAGFTRRYNINEWSKDL